MSTTHDVIDVASAERLDRLRGESRRPEGLTPGERESYLLRLSLDLQLDAMLFTLGAAAASDPAVHGAPHTAGSPTSTSDTGGSQPPALPWRHWLEDDLELTGALAATALALDAGLPPTLGTTTSHCGPQELADSLLVRFESMCGLLTDLLDRADRGGVERPWQPSVRRGLVRCRQRVDELQRHIEALSRAAARGEPTAPRDGSWSTRGAVPAPSSGHQYLPGELLG
jgi:hypothetical protein